MAGVSRKTAVVTGAGSGFGKEICHAFALHGGRGLVCFDVNKEAAIAVAESVNGMGAWTSGGFKDGSHAACASTPSDRLLSSQALPSSSSNCRAVAIHGDVSKEDDVKRAVALCVAEFGEINVMFANAGIVIPARSLFDEDEDLWSHIFRVNVLGVFFAIKHTAIAMREQAQRKTANSGNGDGSKYDCHGECKGKSDVQVRLEHPQARDQRDGGAIVCVASVAGIAAGAGPAAYSASKAAVINLVCEYVHKRRCIYIYIVSCGWESMHLIQL